MFQQSNDLSFPSSRSAAATAAPTCVCVRVMVRVIKKGLKNLRARRAESLRKSERSFGVNKCPRIKSFDGLGTNLCSGNLCNLFPLVRPAQTKRREIVVARYHNISGLSRVKSTFVHVMWKECVKSRGGKLCISLERLVFPRAILYKYIFIFSEILHDRYCISYIFVRHTNFCNIRQNVTAMYVRQG